MTWSHARLGDLLEKVIDNRGKTPPLADDGIELIETTSLTGRGKFPDYSLVRKHVPQDTFDTWFRAGHPRKGDILVATVGANMGSAAIVKEARGCVAQNLVGLRVNSDRCDPDFLYYCLTWERIRAELRGLDIGAAQPSLKVPHLLNVLIPQPSLQLQRRIAGVLSAYDDLIENCRQRIQILEMMARATHREYLRGAPQAGTGILEVDYWKFISANVSPYVGTRRYYATADFDGLRVAGSGIEYAFTEKPSRAQKQPIPFSVWFARMKDTYKIPWYTDVNSEAAATSILSSGFAGFQAVQPVYFPLLFLTISSQEFHKQKDLFCSGATQMSLTNEGLGRIRIPVPHEADARKLGEQSLPLLDQMLVLQLQIENLDRTRDLLLPRFLSGQVVLTDTAA